MIYFRTVDFTAPWTPRYREIAAIAAALRLMNWDRQVMMPAGGSAARVEHIARLTQLRHQLLTSDEFVRSVSDDFAANPTDPQLRVLHREIQQAIRLPGDLVARKAAVASAAYDAWRVAKPTNDFALLRPHLEETFVLAAETSRRLDDSGDIYTPLLDTFEPGATKADVDRMFDGVLSPSRELLREIQTQGRSVEDGPLHGDFDAERLRSVAATILRDCGFDFERGRLDIANNAFCASSDHSDVRATTRHSEHLRGILSSSLHEMGHGLYEQGVAVELAGTPAGGGVSLAVHESQSRLWENIVGRSQGFWRFFYPRIAAAFPSLASISGDDCWARYTRIEPNLIRVGSDELTYNFHIYIRYRAEVEILEGRLAVRDLPEWWNEQYREWLGLTPRTDTEGCLQDVHWSKGSIGYFPTYAMGNLIGGALWGRYVREFPEWESQFTAGNFRTLLAWLTDHVYRHGSTIPPRQLVEQVAGQYLEPTAWLRYINAKYRPLYGLAPDSLASA